MTNTIPTIWVVIYDPMKELTVDGEAGIVVSELVNTYQRPFPSNPVLREGDCVSGVNGCKAPEEILHALRSQDRSSQR